MLYLNKLEEQEVYDLISTAYNRATDDVDLIIEGKVQHYMNLEYSRDEAITNILSEYRKLSEEDNSRIIKGLAGYRTIYKDFSDKTTEFDWEDYSKNCIQFLTNEVFSPRHTIVQNEFDNESHIVKYFEDKILYLEIIHQLGKEKNQQIENASSQKQDETAKKSNKEVLKKMIKFNRDNNDYLFEYLDELKSAFDFNKINDIDFNTICLAIQEKGVFRKETTFAGIVKAIAEYYEIKPPKESKPNKCRERKKKLLELYSILERKLPEK